MSRGQVALSHGLGSFVSLATLQLALGLRPLACGKKSWEKQLLPFFFAQQLFNLFIFIFIFLFFCHILVNVSFMQIKK